MIKNSIYIILFFLIVGCSPEKKATEAPDATTNSWAGLKDYLVLESNKWFSDFGQDFLRPIAWWLSIHGILFATLTLL